MDRTNQYVTHQKTSLIPPAQLFVGPDTAACAHAYRYLKQILCPQMGNDFCITCTQIEAHQHHALLWLQPDKQYTREQLQPIFHTISFALEDHYFFFVIQQADRLTSACANSLLKSLEEPPLGYHFILLTDRPDYLLPTVRSRCITTTIHHETTQSKYEELLQLLLSSTSYDPDAFLKKLEQSTISEQDSLDLLDQLLIYLTNDYKKNLSSDQKEINLAQINLVSQAIANPPMPGSSKLLWKNLFLQITGFFFK
ncbi:MAG: hypothetical protein Q8Q25_01635 [bacterium]|nr:hypothetical protein [bacterium]